MFLGILPEKRSGSAMITPFLTFFISESPNVLETDSFPGRVRQGPSILSFVSGFVKADR